MRKVFASGHNYNGVPHSLIYVLEETSLSGKAIFMLLWLYYRAYIQGPDKLRFTNKEIANAIRVHRNKVPSLRRCIESAGLIKIRAAEGNSYVYTLLDSGEPINTPSVVEEWNNTESAPKTLHSVEQERAPNWYMEKTQEELDISAQIRVCKDSARKAELKERRTALEMARRRAREAAEMDDANHLVSDLNHLVSQRKPFG